MAEIQFAPTVSFTDKVSETYLKQPVRPSAYAVNELEQGLHGIPVETVLAAGQQAIRSFPTEQIVASLDNPVNSIYSLMQHSRALTSTAKGLELLAPGDDPAFLVLAHAADTLRTVVNTDRFDKAEALSSLAMLDTLVLPKNKDSIYMAEEPDIEIYVAFRDPHSLDNLQKIASAAVLMHASGEGGQYEAMARTSVSLLTYPPRQPTIHVSRYSYAQ